MDLTEFNDGEIPENVPIGLRPPFLYLQELFRQQQFGNVNVKGQLPPNLRFVLVSSHCSYFDVFILNSLFYAYGYDSYAVMAAEKVLKSHPLIGFVFARLLHCYPAASSKAIDSSVKILETSPIALCPESWAYLAEQPLKEFKTGAVRIAQKANVPIVPVSIRYNRPGKWIEMFPFPLQIALCFIFKLNKGNIRVNIGRQFDPRGDAKERTKALREEVVKLYEMK